MTTDTRRRVKLYALNADRQWDDRGTGHVSSTYVERLKGISLLVRAEADGSLLLESKIQPDTAYQKQQDTLIVWSEGDNFDLALSFQEKAGCDEIWEKICHVQGKDPSVDITQDIVEESEDERFDETSDSAPPIELPPCELARLEDISEAIASGLTTPLRKEKLAMALESDGYIRKLLVLFNMCEDLANADGLHHLYEIFKNIFLLNKNALFEIMFAEETIFDVVGCLEYEPAGAGGPPRRHRQYLRQLAKFREALPIRSPDLLAKIHQTYRVQYIQDIILPTPSVFVEDNMLNTLSSFIFFNKVEIVTLIQDDEKYLVDMFALLTDRATEDAKRRDIVLFLKEFCSFAQNLQAHGKDLFYKTLAMLGVLPALEITLVMSDQRTKAASIDILTAIVEYSPCIVRNYTLQQVNKTDEEHMLMNIAIEQMLSDSEPELGGAVQIMGVVRILLDPENMITEKNDFLNFFYKHSIQTLIAPLLLNTLDDKPQNEDYQTVQLLGLVLELLSFCVEHHSYHMKNCILQKDLLKRILVLMKSTHTFLVLGALRLLRKIISLKDEFYNRHIVKGNLFAPVVDAFIRNNGRYNLLESAILELFEFIKVEDIKSLCTYVVENFTKIFDEIEYVQTFKHLKGRYEQHQEMLKERDKLLDSIPMIRNIRYKRDQRQLEEEEEIWFNEEEDFSDVPAAKPEIESYSMMKNKLASTAEKAASNGPAAKSATAAPASAAADAASPPAHDHCTSTSSSASASGDAAAAAASSPPAAQHQQHVSNLAATVVAALDHASITAEMLGAAAAAAAAVAALTTTTTTAASPALTPADAATSDTDTEMTAAPAAIADADDDDDDENSGSSRSSFGESEAVEAAMPTTTTAATVAAASAATASVEAAAASDAPPTTLEPSSTAATADDAADQPANHKTSCSDSSSSDSSSSSSSQSMDVDATSTPAVSAAGTTDAAAVGATSTESSTATDAEAALACGKEASAAAGSLKKYLVDYGGDSDEEEESSEAGAAAAAEDTASESPAPHKKARIL